VTHLTFYFEPENPQLAGTGRVKLQLGDVEADDDPTIAVCTFTERGAMRKLVEQANEVAWTAHTTSAWTLTPTPHDSPVDRFERLLEAARNVVEHYNVREPVGDVSPEMDALLRELREAADAWDPK
jgi:hypothetical protein